MRVSWLTRRRGVNGAVAVVLALLLSCTCCTTVPTTPGAEPAAEAGSGGVLIVGRIRTIGVVCGGEAELRTDAYREAQGPEVASEMTAGAGEGARLALDAAGDLLSSIPSNLGGGVDTLLGAGGLLAAGAIFVFAVPLGLVGGAIVASARMVGPQRAEQIVGSIVPALSAYPLKQSLGTHVLATCARSTGYVVVALPAGSASAALGPKVDATLEISAVAVNLEHIEKGLQLRVAARARLVDPNTGIVLRSRDVWVPGRAFGRRRTAPGEEALSSAEIDAYLAALSERIVEALLLTDERLSRVYLGSALWPVTPRPMNWGGYRPRQVDSVHPTLEWTSFPGPRERSADTEEALVSMGDLSYDLRIWRAPEDPYRLVELAYERQAVAGPRHTVEQPLDSGALYYWAVRASFTCAGYSFVTRWSIYPDVAMNLDRSRNLFAGAYGFRTPPAGAE